MKMHQPKMKPWVLAFSLSGLVLACSAGTDDETLPDEPASETGGTTAAPTTPTATGAMGGAAPEVIESAYFGAGNYTGVDLTDPCNTVDEWIPNTNLDHGTGTVVKFEGQLWKITGVLNDANANWARADCNPTDDPVKVADVTSCAFEYKWELVDDCPG